MKNDVDAECRALASHALIEFAKMFAEKEKGEPTDTFVRSPSYLDGPVEYDVKLDHISLNSGPARELRWR